MQKELRQIIAIARNTDPVNPRDDFTAQVMHRISDLQPGREITENDCALCFLTAAYFHFIMGFVFMLVFKKISADMPLPLWLTVQPQIAILTGAGFMISGILMLKKNMAVIRLAQFGILIYVGFVLINGITVYKSLGAIAATGMIWLTGGGILTGLFLGTMLQGYRRGIEI
jgi:hypothetical protein